MVTTAPEVVIRALVTDPAVRNLAELIVVLCLVAVLIEREMVRGRPGRWAATAFRSLSFIAAPLAVAWVVIAVRRFLELAGA